MTGTPSRISAAPAAPELAPIREEARQALARLTAEPVGTAASQ